MGYDTKKQLPLSILAIVKILEMIKLEMEERETEEAWSLVRFGALIAVLTAALLRGYEGFYLDIAATRSHLNDCRHGKIPNKFKRNQLLTEAEVMKLPSVCICLVGKFKGETGERYHSIVLC
jgi:hypothetical protein